MPSRRSALRVGAVVLAVTLGGSYVWFRAAQSRARAEVTIASPQPTTQPAPPTQYLMPSSKSGIARLPATSFSDLSRNLEYTYQDPYPTTSTSAGFKLNNSISAEFAVGQDVKAGIINLMPSAKAPPATQPATTQSHARDVMFYGSKSSRIELLPPPK